MVSDDKLCVFCLDSNSVAIIHRQENTADGYT